MTYYCVAIAAMRDNDDGTSIIRLHPMVVHPDPGVSAEDIALDAARLDMLPEAEGWHSYYAVAYPLDTAIAAIVEAEKSAIPGELRVVRFQPEEPAP